MKTYRVSVNVVRCCDVFVDAETPVEAEHSVLEGHLWRGEDDEAWCDGHLGTESIDECVEVNEGHEEV
jgi:hypothetical protein